VCVNDAEDIKSHPFFLGIDWDTLHLSRPPWIPRIREGQDIAKYFEDEDQILSQTEQPSSSSDEMLREFKQNRQVNPPELAPRVPGFGIPKMKSSHHMNGAEETGQRMLIPGMHPSNMQLVSDIKSYRTQTAFARHSCRNRQRECISNTATCQRGAVQARCRLQGARRMACRAYFEPPRRSRGADGDLRHADQSHQEEQA